MSLVVAVFLPPPPELMRADLLLFDDGYFVIVVIDRCQLFFMFDTIFAFRLYQGTLFEMEDFLDFGGI